MTGSSRRFSKRQVDRLEAVFLAVEALVRRHWNPLAPAREPAGLRARLQEALGVFDEFTWDGDNANGGILPSHFFGPMRPLTIGVRAGMNWD